MLIILAQKPNPDNYIITESPLEQFYNSQIKFEEIGEEVKPLNEYENAIIVFGVILGSSNSRYLDQFFIRGQNNLLDINYLTQSFSDLPKKEKR